MTTSPKRRRVDPVDLSTFLVLLTHANSQGLSQRQLAERMERSPSTITRLLYVARHVYDMTIEAHDQGGYMIKDWGVFNEKKLKAMAKKKWG